VGAWVVGVIVVDTALVVVTIVVVTGFVVVAMVVDTGLVVGADVVEAIVVLTALVVDADVVDGAMVVVAAGRVVVAPARVVETHDVDDPPSSDVPWPSSDLDSCESDPWSSPLFVRARRVVCVG
jgi:hypothetical protein